MKMLKALTLVTLIALAVAAVGCGSNDSGNATLTLPNGKSVTPNSALSWQITSTTCFSAPLFPVGIVYTAAPIYVSSNSTSCGDNGCWLTANTQSLIVVPYVAATSGSTIISEGTYQVGGAFTQPGSGAPSRGAVVYYISTDSACNATTTSSILSGSTGTVTLTSYDSSTGSASGSFEITIPDSGNANEPSGTLSGSFSTAGCGWANTVPYCLGDFTCGGLGCST